jgi:hypothetical protein
MIFLYFVEIGFCIFFGSHFIKIKAVGSVTDGRKISLCHEDCPPYAILIKIELAPSGPKIPYIYFTGYFGYLPPRYAERV